MSAAAPVHAPEKMLQHGETVAAGLLPHAANSAPAIPAPLQGAEADQSDLMQDTSPTAANSSLNMTDSSMQSNQENQAQNQNQQPQQQPTLQQQQQQQPNQQQQSAAAQSQRIAAPASAGAAGSIDVDRIIEKLLEVRGRKPGKTVALAESEIRHLCVTSRAIFASQPILLELEAPIKIVGDMSVRSLLRAL